MSMAGTHASGVLSSVRTLLACSLRYARLWRALLGTHASGVLSSVRTPLACSLRLKHAGGVRTLLLRPFSSYLIFNFDWHCLQVLFTRGAHRTFDFRRHVLGFAFIDLDHDFVVNDIDYLR